MIIKNGSSEAIAYTAEEREEAMEVSLTALASALGYSPIRKGRHFTLQEMDSLIIYNDRTWNRWSRKGTINGGTQIDFMMEFGGIDTPAEAIHQILLFKGSHIVESKPVMNMEAPEEHERREMQLPPKNTDYKRVFAYLIKTRGLSQEVVSDFVHRKLIYEDAVHHNIVFCGYDPDGKIRYAGLRGTSDNYGKKFRMDVPGNNKNYGVNIVNKDSGILLVFEATIDCMSYIDLIKDNSSNKLVLGMVEDNPLQQFLKDYPHITNIKFCLDNDEAGQKAIYGQKDADGNVIRQGLIRKYMDLGYQVDVMIPPIGKDWNESLIAINQAKQTRSLPVRHGR